MMFYRLLPRSEKSPVSPSQLPTGHQLLQPHMHQPKAYDHMYFLLSRISRQWWTLWPIFTIFNPVTATDTQLSALMIISLIADVSLLSVQTEIKPIPSSILSSLPLSLESMHVKQLSSLLTSTLEFDGLDTTIAPSSILEKLSTFPLLHYIKQNTPARFDSDLLDYLKTDPSQDEVLTHFMKHWKQESELKVDRESLIKVPHTISDFMDHSSENQENEGGTGQPLEWTAGDINHPQDWTAEHLDTSADDGKALSF